MNLKRTYIIAEIGGNFTDTEQAFQLIDAAAECGVDAIKLQTYRADTLSSKKAMFDMENTGVLSQYELFKKYEFDMNFHKCFFDYAQKKGLDVFSTPSHISDVNMLEEIGCNIYKIGSDDAVNTPFLKNIAKTGKTIILSTGMCTMQEVRESVNAILSEGCSDLMLLHAVTEYPTHAEDVNLLAMTAMMNEFPNIPIGYSDHTIGITASIAAVAMGAKIIEKHFTYDKNAEGPDHILSADPEEMKQLVDTIREIEILKGNGIKMPAKGEKTTRKNNRKSIVVVKNISEGEIIDKNNVDIKRPGYGIEPKYLEQIFGKKVNKDLKYDDILTWSDLQ